MEKQITHEPIAIGFIAQEDVIKLLQQSPEKISIIDVRSPEEYAEKHIPVAINIPLSELENHSEKFSKKLIFITACGKGGGRSAQAAYMLRQKGFNAGWLCGGTIGWLG